MANFTFQRYVFWPQQMLAIGAKLELVELIWNKASFQIFQGTEPLENEGYYKDLTIVG